MSVSPNALSSAMHSTDVHYETQAIIYALWPNSSHDANVSGIRVVDVGEALERTHNGAKSLWQLGRCTAERGMGWREDRFTQLTQPAGCRLPQPSSPPGPLFSGWGLYCGTATLKLRLDYTKDYSLSSVGF
ncbi:hypothetical protein NQZ68_005452 [Dissostichus eleginoides]|nr:hypothetical protein NQZ68_005452 [Dissostichus eleginoides]